MSGSACSPRTAARLACIARASPPRRRAGLREKCGVFGIAGHAEAAAHTALGLHALQHRGQEGAGITAFDGQHFRSEHRPGLVGDHFTSPKTIDALAGGHAIGHVRYATFGESTLRNIQPLYADISGGGLACAHNGHITNAISLRRELVRQGCIFQSTCDTEVILHLAAMSRAQTMAERIIEALRRIEGAYALVMLANDTLIGARDPKGIRPLVLGKFGSAPVLASESCAFDIIGADYIREIEPGEMVMIRNGKTKSFRPFPKHKARPCIFEYVYFARPDSLSRGQSFYDYRRRMGAALAREAPVEADLVAAVPDSGVPAAIGYAEQSGLPFEHAITRNHYVGRTFIEPTQAIRRFGVKLKHNPNPSLIRGKRLVLVDDSVVRGNTGCKLAQLLYDAGAKEIHLRIACPPIRYPDVYGIDTPDAGELLANRFTGDKMRDYLGVNSLAFLSLDGLYRAMGETGRNEAQPQFTDHCFTGDYPTALTDRTAHIEHTQLSLLNLEK